MLVISVRIGCHHRSCAARFRRLIVSQLCYYIRKGNMRCVFIQLQIASPATVNFYCKMTYLLNLDSSVGQSFAGLSNLISLGDVIP